MPPFSHHHLFLRHCHRDQHKKIHDQPEDLRRRCRCYNTTVYLFMYPCHATSRRVTMTNLRTFVAPLFTTNHHRHRHTRHSSEQTSTPSILHSTTHQKPNESPPSQPPWEPPPPFTNTSRTIITHHCVPLLWRQPNSQTRAIAWALAANDPLWSVTFSETLSSFKYFLFLIKALIF